MFSCAKVYLNFKIFFRDIIRRGHYDERSEEVICPNFFKPSTASFGVLFTNYGFKKYFTQRSQRKRNGRNVGTRGARCVFLSWRSWREIITMKRTHPLCLELIMHVNQATTTIPNLIFMIQNLKSIHHDTLPLEISRLLHQR